MHRAQMRPVQAMAAPCMGATVTDSGLRPLPSTGLAGTHQVVMPCHCNASRESPPALLMGRGFSTATPSSAATVTASLAAGLQAHAAVRWVPRTGCGGVR